MLRERLEYVEAVRRIGANLALPREQWPPGMQRLAVVGTDVEATVSPSAVRGWQARDRPVQTTFPPDRERYAALADALEAGAYRGNRERPLVAHPVRHVNPPAGAPLRLHLDGDGALRLA